MENVLLPLFSIVGTTSVGKSETVFHLAQCILEKKRATSIVIISADSRQVFTGLEILTGADVPTGFEKISEPTICDYSFYRKEAIEIFGLSVLSVDKEWSVSQFQVFAHKIIQYAQKKNAIVFIVGGTGLYHAHLLNTDPTLHIPPNLEVRQKAEALSVPELQTWLQTVSEKKIIAMNNSDRNNPRRLVRAIEIGLFESQFTDKKAPVSLEAQPEHIYLGLHTSQELLQENITQRVKKRFSGGAVEEGAQILEHTPALSEQARTTLGLSELQKYIQGEIPAEKCLEEWALADFQYSKRQLTWWKKQTQVQWFDKTTESWLLDITQSVLDRLPEIIYT